LKRYLPYLLMAAASLLIAAVLALYFREWLRVQVVIPLVYAGWVVYLLILSLPQHVYWGALLLTGLLIFLTTSLPKPAQVRSIKLPTVERSFSRYASWLRYSLMMNRSVFASDNLARDLVRLAVQILASQLNLTTEEVYRKLDHGEIELPPELATFLRRRGFQSMPEPESRLQEWIHRFFPARAAANPPGVYTPLERETMQMISLIEGLLVQPTPDLQETDEVRYTQ